VIASSGNFSVISTPEVCRANLHRVGKRLRRICRGTNLYAHVEVPGPV
jgi:hypothetical protein